ncbi:M48 family metallopeptidase [Rapidithrix thailandica]|uniref:M48 family metallopeptidase n=1 Tax=Rapidithrix thailandica TaxID=413964 RepID=A0AAW9S1S2_9BACT
MKPSNRKKRIQLTNVHSSAWEHPADRVALKSLRKVPGLDVVIRTVFGATSEKSLRLLTLASAVRVSDKQFSRIHTLYQEACEVLDVKEVPELYVSQSPLLNAGAIGMDKPFITLNSSMLDTMDDNEIITVLGHELGHILSGHVLYKTLLQILLSVSTIAFNIPLGGVAIYSIIAALREWDRKSELSADRAGLLVSQDPEASIHLLMKMSGGGRLQEMNLGEFMKQAEEYNNLKSLGDNIHKIMNLLWKTHPFPVIRLLELMNWIRSGEYDAILAGNYPTEGSEFKEDMRQAASGYATDFKSTFSPILDDIKDSAGTASKKAKDFFDEFLKKG